MGMETCHDSESGHRETIPSTRYPMGMETRAALMKRISDIESARYPMGIGDLFQEDEL